MSPSNRPNCLVITSGLRFGRVSGRSSVVEPGADFLSVSGRWFDSSRSREFSSTLPPFLALVHPRLFFV